MISTDVLLKKLKTCDLSKNFQDNKKPLDFLLTLKKQSNSPVTHQGIQECLLLLYSRISFEVLEKGKELVVFTDEPNLLKLTIIRMHITVVQYLFKVNTKSNAREVQEVVEKIKVCIEATRSCAKKSLDEVAATVSASTSISMPQAKDQNNKSTEGDQKTKKDKVFKPVNASVQPTLSTATAASKTNVSIAAVRTTVTSSLPSKLILNAKPIPYTIEMFLQTWKERTEQQSCGGYREAESSSCLYDLLPNAYKTPRQSYTQSYNILCFSQQKENLIFCQPYLTYDINKVFIQETAPLISSAALESASTIAAPLLSKNSKDSIEPSKVSLRKYNLLQFLCAAIHQKTAKSLQLSQTQREQLVDMVACLAINANARINSEPQGENSLANILAAIQSGFLQALPLLEVMLLRCDLQANIDFLNMGQGMKILDYVWGIGENIYENEESVAPALNSVCRYRNLKLELQLIVSIAIMKNMKITGNSASSYTDSKDSHFLANLNMELAVFAAIRKRLESETDKPIPIIDVLDILEENIASSYVVKEMQNIPKGSSNPKIFS